MISRNSCFICVGAVSIFVNLIFAAEYGKFGLDIIEYEVIINEHMRSFIKIDVVPTHFSNGTFKIQVFAHVKKQLGVIGLKLRSYTWNEVTSKFMLTVNLAVKNICEKQFARGLVSSLPGLEKNCAVKPGEYNFTILDLNTIVQQMTNGKFFYGKYMALTDVLSGKMGRILRSNVTAIIKPEL